MHFLSQLKSFVRAFLSEESKANVVASCFMQRIWSKVLIYQKILCERVNWDEFLKKDEKNFNFEKGLLSGKVFLSSI